MKKKILLFVVALGILLGEGVVGFAFLHSVNTVRDGIIKLSDAIIATDPNELNK